MQIGDCYDVLSYNRDYMYTIEITYIGELTEAIILTDNNYATRGTRAKWHTSSLEKWFIMGELILNKKYKLKQLLSKCTYTT